MQKLKEGQFICPDCNEIHEESEGYYIEDIDQVICEDCFNGGDYFTCEDCGCHYSYNSDNYYISDGYGYTICYSCRCNGNYGYCEDCGDYHNFDNLTCVSDSYYCENCVDNHYNEGLYSYHEFDDWEFFKGSNEENPTYYVGPEIELEPKGYSNVSGVLTAIYNNINAVGMEDSSLSGGGVEVVGHPQSIKYYEEHKQDYINFFNEIKDINYGNAGGAGLHFHVSRPNENVVSRVIILLESFKEEIKKLSRRNGRFSWSKFLTDNVSTKEQVKFQSSKYLKDEYLKGYTERYNALNLQNSNTIEFRFFNGPNNFEEFWASLQFIKNVMSVALDEDRPIDTINWMELIDGEELVNQAIQCQVLGINKFAKDTTSILEKIEIAEEKAKNEIKRTLKNFIRYMNRELADTRLDTIKSSKIEEITSKGNQIVDKLYGDLRYLDNIIQYYKYLDEYSLQRIKDNFNYIKINNPKSKKYSRYFKQVEKTILNYESEVSQ